LKKLEKLKNRKFRLAARVLFVLFLLNLGFGPFPADKGIDAKKEKKFISDYKVYVDKIISPAKLDLYLKYFASEPHVASSPRNNELAKFILEEWKSYGLEDVHFAEYDVLLSFPEKIMVEMVSPKKVTLNLKEEGYKEDPDTLRTDLGLPYNAYSCSGDIVAPLIYANSGNPQDYDYLEKKGIGLKGKVALVRYSSPYSYRGFKALTAERRGLAGLLIYSDPKDDGSARGKVFPDGPWGPMSHIQRGGIPFDFIYPGDPLTPGWASLPGCKRLFQDEAITLPRIISVPLSAQDALPLLQSMKGEKAPKEWKGALPVTYRLGGDSPLVHIDIEMDNSAKRIINVLGCIKGSGESDEIVLVGNHRDAWIFGGVDPSSGTASLMELARSLAGANKAGFRPLRTICFASWDAEEFTLTGSTEWGEENRDSLQKNLIAYLNVDSSACGKKFGAQGVPSLSRVIVQALKEVQNPDSKTSVYDQWGKESKEKGRVLVANGNGVLEPIGSGSDHTVFLNHIGAPALDMGFGGDYGVYHSRYDDYYWMTRFGDPGMRYSAALTKIWAHLAIELATSPLVPLDYESCAIELRRYLEEWAKQFDPSKKKLEMVFELVEEMKKNASALNPYIFNQGNGEKVPDAEKIQEANRLLLRIERDFTISEGIPSRNWFKHLIFGTRYTYAVLLLPELQEAAEAEDEKGVAIAITHLEQALRKVVSKLKDIANILGDYP
jgi:N-acetylated-alpha-linked acidic dipeptidase